MRTPRGWLGYRATLNGVWVLVGHGGDNFFLSLLQVLGEREGERKGKGRGEKKGKKSQREIEIE